MLGCELCGESSVNVETLQGGPIRNHADCFAVVNGAVRRGHCITRYATEIFRTQAATIIVRLIVEPEYLRALIVKVCR